MPTANPYGSGAAAVALPAKKRPFKSFGTEPVDEALNQAGDEAFRIRDEEESRGAKAEGFLSDEFAKSNRPTLTDEDISRMFTSKADEASRTQLDQEAGLRANLGASGIQGGGYAAGLLTGFQSQYSATVTDGRRALAITKAQSDANDAAERFKKAGVLAQQMGRDPSTAGSDFLNDAAGITLAKYGIDKQAKAAKKSASNDLLGGIFKGGLGVLAGIA